MCWSVFPTPPPFAPHPFPFPGRSGDSSLRANCIGPPALAGQKILLKTPSYVPALSSQSTSHSNPTAQVGPSSLRKPENQAKSQEEEDQVNCSWGQGLGKRGICERGGEVIMNHFAQPLHPLNPPPSPRAQVPGGLGPPPSGESGPLCWGHMGDPFRMRQWCSWIT